MKMTSEAKPPYEAVALPTPYPVGRVNAYLLPESSPSLIDAGVRSERSLAELEARMDARGLKLEAIDTVLVTHLHNDHAGAAPEIARRASAPIRCHEESLVDEERGRAAFLELIARYGAPPRTTEELRQAWALSDQFGEPLTGAAEVEILADGEHLRAGDVELEALHTPGHAPGHLCFLARELGALFCGDLLLEQITSNPLPHFDESEPRGRRVSLALYLDSLARIESLGPLLGLPGHGAVLADTAAAARRAAGHINARNKKVLKIMRSFPGANLFELAGKFFFQEQHVLGQTLAFCELLAHADLLEVRGQIEVDDSCGVPHITKDDRVG